MALLWFKHDGYPKPYSLDSHLTELGVTSRFLKISVGRNPYIKNNVAGKAFYNGSRRLNCISY